ncbi:podocan-like [Mercenaria mercenaria]|uniref:podocan-like n=1 Tax=Mercenaria mercenaria TaxID=6596 RepID=UPI00234FB53C|nr:podocan-like [Mercenaria mercenaria]
MEGGTTVLTCWMFACLIFCINGLTPGCEYVHLTLTCSGPNMTDVPENIFANTTEIKIKHADIKTLNTSAFSQTKKLHGLIVEHSGVTDLVDEAFAELKFLDMISLKGNKLITLQNGIFSNLTLLKVLRLSENSLVSVDGIFDGLTNLEKLSLNDNQIVTIATDTFRDLTSLHHLELNNNKIKEIQPGAFENMKMLMLLGLGDNPIRSVDNIFPSDMMLQYLNQTACELSTFPSDLPSSLKYLKLTKNKIRRISKSDTQRYSDLNALILEDNGLEYIEPGSFSSMTSLTDIFLFVNYLEHIPGPFPASIKSIHLDNNRIESIPPDIFQNGTKLNILSLRINNITSIHTNAFQNIESIQELHLERNTLSILHDETFKFALRLKYLNLNHLTLTAVYPDCFSNLNSLTKLEMSFVRVSKDQVYGNIFRNLPMLEELQLQESPTLAEIFITNLIIERKKVKTITQLNLEDNGLETLSSDVQKYLPNIQKLSLRGNNFHCNANILWLRIWHNIEPDKLHKFDQVRCYLPRHLQGQRIEDVQIGQFNDQTSSENDNLDTVSHPYHIPTDDPFQTTTEQAYYFHYPDYDYEYLYQYDYSNGSTVQSISNHPIPALTFQTTTPLSEDDRKTVNSNNTVETYNHSNNSTIKSISNHSRQATIFKTATPLSDDGKQTENPNIKNHDIGHTGKPPAQNNGGNSSSLKTVGIAFGMAFGVIIVMLFGALLVYKLWQRKRNAAMKTGRHQNGGQDYVFVAAQTDRRDKPEPKVHRKLSRAERGSTTSHASEDITNSDTDMKVYIMDIDA